MNMISVQNHIIAYNINIKYFAFHVSAVRQEIYTFPGVGWCRVFGGWISWNYNQLSQAKAEAETEFGNIRLYTTIEKVPEFEVPERKYLIRAT